MFSDKKHVIYEKKFKISGHHTQPLEAVLVLLLLLVHLQKCDG